MTVTRDRNGEALERFDVCRNIHQEGGIQFYYYIGTNEMSEFRGKVMALFSNVNSGRVHTYERQALRQKRQNGGRRAWPDMFIACTLKVIIRFDFNRNIDVSERVPCGGLFLELKREGTRLKKKNGEWATEHIAEQAKVLDDLRERGYCAEFAVGFDEAKRIIDEYLGQ